MAGCEGRWKNSVFGYAEHCAELDVSLKDEIVIKSTKQTRTSAVDERKRFNDVLALLMALSENEGRGGDGEVKEATVDDSECSGWGESCQAVGGATVQL
jgi:hypothetical protein